MASNLDYVLRIKDEATQTLQSFGKSLNDTESKGTKSFKNIGVEMAATGAILTAITVPLIGFGVSAVGVANDIETAWAGIRKVYDGSASDIDNLLKPAVRGLSVEYAKNQQEILKVMDALAAMGNKGSELIDKTTQSLQFAVLGNMELDQAMKAVVATSAIFGVQGEELTKMLATMNTAENTGAATMSDLADSISTAGNVAKVAGVDIKELNAMMSVLRQRGVDAGEAANSLKTIITRLRAPTEDGKAIMDKYGISLFETTKKFGTFNVVTGQNSEKLKELKKVIDGKTKSLEKYQTGINGATMSAKAKEKAMSGLRSEIEAAKNEMNKYGGTTKTVTGYQNVMTGKMKQADQVLIDISKSWGKMTDMEKEEMAQSVGMLYQKDKFLALMDDLNSKNSEYNKILQAQANDSANVAGYYNELNIAMDTNAFKIEQARQNWENLKITLGEMVQTYITPIIDKLGVFVGKLDEFLKQNPQVVQALVAFTVALAGISTVLAIVGGLMLLLNSPMALLAVGIALAIAAFVLFQDQLQMFADWFTATIMPFLNLIWEEMQRFWTEIQPKLQEAMDTVKKKFDTYVEGVKALGKEFEKWWQEHGDTVITILKVTWEIMLTTLKLAWNAIKTFIKVALDVFNGDWKAAWQDVKQGFINAWDIMADGVVRVWDKIKSKVEEGVNFVIGKLNSLISKFNEVSGMNIGGLKGVSFDTGGWVTNSGLAMVHKGEFVMSNDMLAGKKTIPQEVSNTNTTNQPINVTANINTQMDAYTLGNILGQQLAFAGR